MRRSRRGSEPKLFWCVCDLAVGARKLGREACGMADKTLKRILTRAKRQPGGKKSPAYHWLRTHHAALTKARRVTPPSWSDVAVEMRRDGIIGGRGTVLTERAVKEIWDRVCADVTRDTEVAAANPGPTLPLYPSRFPANRLPVEYPRPSAPSRPPSPPKPAEQNPPALPTDRTPAQARADAQIERLRRTVAERSGRKYVP